LGELGPNYRSSQFLLNEIINERNSSLDLHAALEALGKCGDENSLNRMIELYSEKGLSKYSGISFSLYNYFNRGIGSKEKIARVILNEIGANNFLSNENFEAVFALYRTFVPDSAKNILLKELNFLLSPAVRNNLSAINTIPYLLRCLRKLSYFPQDLRLLNKLLGSKYFVIKVEAAHSLIYYPFKNPNELDKYISLLNNRNTNIVRAALNSLTDIKLNAELNDQLQNNLAKRLIGKTFDEVNRGELFLTFIKLFPRSFMSTKNQFERLVPKEYFYQACGQFQNSDSAAAYLINHYGIENNKNKMVILQSLLNFQNKYYYDKDFNYIIIGAIASNSAPLIAISSDGIDSSFIAHNQDTLKDIILKQINKYKDDPGFQESIMSLTNLALKLNKNLYDLALSKLKDANFYSIKKFSYKLLKIPYLSLTKSPVEFNIIYDNIFKYKYAEVITFKGKILFELLPGLAPVSVGNFCYLALKNFYNNNSFHRVVPGFIIQGGDPDETGWGGPGYDIVSEFSSLDYSPGMVGMASAGKDTEGSQWFITTGSYPHLNGRYTIFGMVKKGLQETYKIEQGDKILKVNLIVK
jgi:cyclophilin family peptidyl-prolyl cis-trans isomerase